MDGVEGEAHVPRLITRRGRLSVSVSPLFLYFSSFLFKFPFIEHELIGFVTVGYRFRNVGSSTGSAVAVAAGFAPASIGSETFGSICMPADRTVSHSSSSKLSGQTWLPPESYTY
jgi:hypothetical protein